MHRSDLGLGIGVRRADAGRGLLAAAAVAALLATVLATVAGPSPAAAADERPLECTTGSPPGECLVYTSDQASVTVSGSVGSGGTATVQANVVAPPCTSHAESGCYDFLAFAQQATGRFGNQIICPYLDSGGEAHAGQCPGSADGGTFDVVDADGACFDYWAYYADQDGERSHITWAGDGLATTHADCAYEYSIEEPLPLNGEPTWVAFRLEVRVRTAPSPCNPAGYCTATTVIRSVVDYLIDFGTGEVVLVVNDTGDGGDTDVGDPACDSDAAEEGSQCTLRAAIEQANESADIRIQFAIPGTGDAIRLIVLEGEEPLPALAGAPSIDATTQPGAGMVAVDGSAVATGPGLVVQGADRVVSGLALGGFTSHGLVLEGDDAVVRDVWSGTLDGVTPRANGGHGIVTPETGGTTLERVVASGNDGIGIVLRGDGNTVEDSRVGVTIAGSAALANAEAGIVVEGGAETSITRSDIGANGAAGIDVAPGSSAVTITGNTIGGADGLGNAGPGVLVQAGDEGEGATVTVGGPDEDDANVLAGNAAGVTVDGGDVRIEGNLVGLLDDGTAAGNVDAGIVSLVPVEVVANTIAANGTGEEPARTGVALFGGGTVTGNVIGLDTEGEPMGNDGPGVHISGGTATIGGAATADRNVISGNAGPGVFVAGAPGEGQVTVLGNRIGTDATGMLPRPNTGPGVAVGEGAVPVTIGGATGTTPGGACTGDCNVISANGAHGIDVAGPENGDTTILGNRIGLGADGALDLGNAGHGVRIASGSGVHRIGDATPAGRNTISGNGSSGVAVSGTDDILVRGNHIGTDAAGAAGRKNDDNGIDVRNSDRIELAGNVVAGHLCDVCEERGFGLLLIGAHDLAISGNRIGTDAAGTAAIPNSIGLSANAAAGTIGGDEGWQPTTACTGDCNLLSGNQGAAMSVGPSGELTISGNVVGLDASGTAALPNTASPSGNVQLIGIGISVDGSATASVRGNLVSGNAGWGIQTGVDDVADFVPALIEGNYVGVDTSGNAPIGNRNAGIIVSTPGSTVRGNVVGATQTYEGGPAEATVEIGVRAPNAIVVGNTVGLGADQTTPLDGAGRGIALVDSTGGFTADGTRVGGTDPADANVIGAMPGSGIDVEDVDGVTIQGNRIGIGAGDVAVPNGRGIRVTGAHGAVIGGATAAAANLIANSTGPGVLVDLSDGIDLRGTTFEANTGLAIDLFPIGPTANDAGDADGGPNLLQNHPELVAAVRDAGAVTASVTLDSTPSTTFSVEVFAAATCGTRGEGATSLGRHAVTTSADGTVAVDLPIGATPATQLTATATDPAGNTSELSPCVSVEGAPPVVDDDGIPEATEDAAPNGGDGNDDGIPDSEQAEVASFPNATGGDYVTLVAPAGTQLVDVAATSPPPGTPAGHDFPIGAVSFEVELAEPGDAVTIELIDHSGAGFDSYFKFGPEPGDETDHWYEFAYDGTTGAELTAEGVVLHLVDGERGDADLTADGRIVDPGAPAVDDDPPVPPGPPGPPGPSTPPTTEVPPTPPTACDGADRRDFTDVPVGNVHADAIGCLAALGIVTGTASGTFGPDQPVTRGQLASLLARLADHLGAALPTDPPDAFDDDAAPHEVAIDRLAAAGVLAGIGDRRFDPSAAVSRAQLATMLHGAWPILFGEALPAGADAFGDDDGSVHEAAIDALAAAGVLDGTAPGVVDPGGHARRDQVASLLARILAAAA